MIKKTSGLFFVSGLILAVCSCAPVTINTVPPGAEVYGADGKTRLGTTPYKTSVFVGDKRFAVRKDRYFEEPVKLDFDAPRRVDLKLRPTPVLVYSKPVADIYPAGSTTSIGRTPKEVTVTDKNQTYTLKAADYYDQDVTVGIESTDPLVVKLARRPIVTLSAKPAGVQVYEKNKLVGTAPVRPEILSSRTFEFRKAGYFTKSITVTGTPPYEVAVELKPFPIVTLATTPAGAQIYRAGTLVGKAPIKFAVGEKTVLEVRADRYYPQSITLSPDSPAQVNVDLKPMPYVTIKSEPAGAEVFIGGKSVGTAPVEQLIEKDTAVEVRKEGFVTKTATLTGADNQVSITLEKVPEPVAAPVPAVSATNAQKPAAAATPAPASAAPAAQKKEPVQKETVWQKVMKFFGK